MPKILQVQPAGRPAEPVDESNFSIAESDTPKPDGGKGDRRDRCVSIVPGRFQGEVPERSPARSH